MWLLIRSGEQTGRVVEITGERFVIGRDEDCDLTLSDEKISRKHASFVRHPDGRVVVQDLGSTNGTYLDEQRITQATEVRGDEAVRVGDTQMVISVDQPSGTPTTVGVMPSGAPQPAPPRRTGFTAERLLLRRGVKRATLIGILAGAAALIAAGIGLFVWLGEDEPAGDRPSPEEIVQAIRPATVLVDVLVQGQSVGGGTGWVLDADEGLIVTNAHVVNAGETFEVGVNGGNPDPDADLQRREATVVGVAPCEDLAVIKVDDTTGLEEVSLGSQSDLQQGETVVALGFPASASLESNLSATVGAVSVVRETFDLESLDVPQYTNVIRTDAAINPGNSGGPLLDLDKTLVGVNSAGITLLGGRTIQGEAFAIGVDRVKEIVPTLERGESMGWTGAGLAFPTAAEDLTALGLPAQDGIIISHAVPGTAAADAGLGQEPSLLVSVNGTPVEGFLQSYCNAVGDVASGETLTFGVIEAGTTRTTDVQVTTE